jgi:hypothetical protein
MLLVLFYTFTCNMSLFVAFITLGGFFAVSSHMPFFSTSIALCYIILVLFFVCFFFVRVSSFLSFFDLDCFSKSINIFNKTCSIVLSFSGVMVFSPVGLGGVVGFKDLGGVVDLDCFCVQ